LKDLGHRWIGGLPVAAPSILVSTTLVAPAALKIGRVRQCQRTTRTRRTPEAADAYRNLGRWPMAWMSRFVQRTK
jgi:hypothetical protein